VSVRLARGHHIRTDHSTAVESATRWQEAWFRRLYGDRLNQFDFRFTKIVGVSRSRVDLNVDLYNGWIRKQVCASVQRALTAHASVSARTDFRCGIE
jgi:hypothetical protein